MSYEFVNCREPQGGARPIYAFPSFNDFITREIDLSRRPINRDPQVCVAPADGRVLAYPVVDAESSFTIKRATFNLRKLLRDKELITAYSGGSLFVSRLYLTDYHHFHFPDDGVAHAAFSIPGRYFTVSPCSERRLLSFYAENHRMVTLFEADQAPKVLLAAIRKVLRGGKYVSESLAEKAVLQMVSETTKPLHETLSDREYQVMRMIAAGKTIKEIAKELFLSVRTVSTYRARVLEKMNMKSNTELIRYALENKLID